jgi:hypothetical protein
VRRTVCVEVHLAQSYRVRSDLVHEADLVQ